jgi:hypothetical protein
MRSDIVSTCSRGIWFTFLWGIVLSPNLVLAQSLGTLTVTFASAAASVPLSPWVVALSALAVASIALWKLRHRSPDKFGRLPTWLMAVAIVAACIAGVRSGIVMRDADAQATLIPLPLTVSPTSVGITTLPSRFQATNQTGAPVKITSMHVTNAVCVSVASPPSTCILGARLMPGQSCIIGVQETFDPCPPG